MQKQCKSALEELFPDNTVRVSGGDLLMNLPSITNAAFNNLSEIEGMYSEIAVKRSGTGLVVILTFSDPL